jgi:hypothetical protein
MILGYFTPKLGIFHKFVIYNSIALIRLPGSSESNKLAKPATVLIDLSKRPSANFWEGRSSPNSAGRIKFEIRTKPLL